MTELDAAYNPSRYETRWWDFWTSEGFFHAEATSSKPPYTILMPPPNVTSQLHMGHGLNNTLQDIMIRWKRMQGYNACWLPGTDHAGIATQMMVERALAKEGKRKEDIGREAFLEMLWHWKETYGGIIIQQLKRMGCSADWPREAFTMNPGLSRAVRHIFVTLFNEGLIYRGERLVNWDPVLKTAISDDEVENKEATGSLWYFRYPLADGDGQVTVATTRPETMLGDTAVAVNPDDDRYKHLIGRYLKLPLTDRLVPIVADAYVKSEFGTGAVKITPAHDPNDFKIGKAHELPMINVMNDDATMSDNVPERFRGLDRFVARKEVVAAMKELGFFEKEEPHKLSVPHSERSKTVIEPRLSSQWFVKMGPLVGPAIEAAKSGELRFHPESWKKTYLHWLENIQDWCISRQLWWGHRLPIWYCRSCDAVMSSLNDPSQCDKCGSKDLRQDPDVLDTWFSSWLWPVSPFGWPDRTASLETFYPSNVLMTAPEIIFLWVARMVIVGLKTMGQLPFRDVYLNATVCDKSGRKMSKTLGNGIDPLEMIDKHGADAMRFTVVSLAPIGGRVRVAESDFEAGGRFVNKLWNAARFLLKYVDETKALRPLSLLKLNLPEAWLVDEFRRATESINRDLAAYRINEAVDTLYHFLWGSYCDWGLECAKEALNGDDEEAKQRAISVLVYVLDGALRLASPVMPFVSEELWHKLPHHPGWDRPASLVVAAFPDAASIPSHVDASEEWQNVQRLINAIRSVRTQAGLAPKESVALWVRAKEPLIGVFERAGVWIKRLTGANSLVVSPEAQRPPQSLVAVGPGFEAFIPVAGILDIDKEKIRLSAEIERVGRIVKGLEGKLANAAFVDKAPADVVDATRAQEANMKGQLESLRQNLAALS